MSPGGFRRPPTSYRRARRVDRGAAGGHLVKPEGWPSNWPGPQSLTGLPHKAISAKRSRPAPARRQRHVAPLLGDVRPRVRETVRRLGWERKNTNVAGPGFKLK